MLSKAPRLVVLNLAASGTDVNVCAALGATLDAWGVPMRLFALHAGADPSSSDTRAHARALGLDVLSLDAASSSEPSSLVKTFVVGAQGSDLCLVFLDGPDATRFADAESPVVRAASSLGLPAVALCVIDICPDKLRAVSRQWTLSGLLAVSAEPDSVAGLREAASALDVPFLGTFDEGIPSSPRNGPRAPLAPADTAESRSLDASVLIRLAGMAPDLHTDEASPFLSVHRSKSPLSKRAQDGAAKVLMIQGTSSNAGKTFLVAALARYFSNRGLSVAPFKGQNMSNNARVVSGGEIGVAQYLQALAARTTPEVRMNPVLIKPQAVGSQVILMGKPDYQLGAMPWRLRKPLCWRQVQESLTGLRKENDLIIVEGAGSPMETYLRDNDIVNMRVALEAQAKVLIATDAARGGAFPHLYGTWLMMRPEEKELIKGFILNLFFANGDSSMLLPGCTHLQQLTAGTPVLGIIPEIDHKLPDEDLFSLRRGRRPGTGYKIAIVAFPQMANFDEFKPLESLQAASVEWVSSPEELSDADLVILPGSKHVAADLAWIRERSLDQPIVQHAKQGKKVLGICGGLQMLGGPIEDPYGVEEASYGLGILPLKTTYAKDKLQRQVTRKFPPLQGSWGPLSQLAVSGYEIRQGRTELQERGPSCIPGSVLEVFSDGAGFACENVLGLYLHGVFENDGVISSCFNEQVRLAAELDATFEKLSDTLEQYLDMNAIEQIALS